jgi:NitT/TauT family transport system permease protein
MSDLATAQRRPADGDRPRRRRPQRRTQPGRLSRPVVLLVQALLIAVILLLWQYASDIPFIGGKWVVLNPFFISSPSAVASELWTQLFTADGQMPGYLWATVGSTLVGLAIGLVTGSLCGLLLSNSEALAQIIRPFLVAFNAVPRVALIPVIVIIVGPSFEASVVSCFIVVFFVVFFSAYEGGRTVPKHMLQNARLLGASRWEMMRTVRFPCVLAWTFASLPVAVTFGLITVVTTEILTGAGGMGHLIVTALATSEATLTFATIVALGVVGLVIVLIADAIKAKMLHWWEESDAIGGR